MKTITIEATFPDLETEGYEVKIKETADATTLRSGISRAVAAIIANPELKRKRYTNINMVVSIAKAEVE